MRKMALRPADKKRKGFTLVELIVVISILAILAVGAVVAFGNVRETAERNTALANASVIARALNTYNSLAGAGNAKVDWEDYDDLVLDTGEGDLIDMDLSVSLSSEEHANIEKHVVIDGSGGTFTVTPK